MKLRPSHTAVTIGHDGEEGMCGYCGVLPTFLLLSLLPFLLSPPQDPGRTPCPPYYRHPVATVMMVDLLVL